MAGSHYTYIPWFKNEKKDEDLKELKKELNILRFCVQCNEFKLFVFKKGEALWFYLKCPDCEETIKIPRKTNYAASKWDKEKWK